VVVSYAEAANTMAVQRGCNPDTFRRDVPRYQAAFGLLTL
jgi:hypothetical protein